MRFFLTYFIMLISLGSFQITSAQEIEWQNTIGGNDWDNLNEICQTSDGGYICGGWSRSNISGDKTENNVGADDYWVVKLDSLGNIEWQNSIGGLSGDILNSLEQTSDGGYICGGSSSSNASGDKTENSNGSVDYWVVKLDSVGNILWQNTLGGATEDFLFSISQTFDDGYICGGKSNSNISGDKTENCQGDYDFWIVKLDSLGVIQWQNTIGGNDDDWLFSISQTADSGYVSGGRSRSPISGDKTEGSYGGFAYWVVKIDVSGNIQWQNSIGGGMVDELYSVHQTMDGGYICGGSSNSPNAFDKTEESQGTYDIWIVKLDSIGTIQWQNTIGGIYVDWLRSMSPTTDGGYICGGYSSSILSGDKNENLNGNENFWLVKLDSSGNIVWQNNIGGDTNEHLYSIIQSSDGGIVAGGISYSNISGDKTEDSMGGHDFWVVKISNNYNLIEGRAFLDDNTNGTFETSETALVNKIVTETTTGRIGITQNDGKYTVAVPDTGNFEVYGPEWNYYATVPISHNAYFNNFLITDSLNDFAVQSSGTYNDLCVHITPVGNFRSVFNAYYYVNYSNFGTTILSPTVVFYPDTNVIYSSADILPTSITSDSIVWNLGPLLPFATEKIMITVQVDLGLPIGTLINSGALIEPIAGDANLICNQSYWEILTTGSSDPNDILVSHDTLTITEVANGQFLDYIIRFQNTGNDTAFTVKILNPIDTINLNLSTFEFISSSHSLNLNWIQWERNMEFKFENILLPDSSTNESLSHGFVRYRIQPRNILTAGDSITNFAAIYFDFNDPVITNTAKTDIVLPTSIDEHYNSTISSYPSPFENDITIELKGHSHQKLVIELSNMYGQKVKTLYSGTMETDNWKRKFDLSGLSKGIYILSIQTKDIISQKIVKL